MWISNSSINSNIDITDYDPKEKLECNRNRDFTDIPNNKEKNKKETKKSKSDKNKKNNKKNTSSLTKEKYDEILQQAREENKRIDKNIDKVKEEMLLLDKKMEQIKLNGIEYSRVHRERIESINDSINKTSHQREQMQQNIEALNSNKSCKVRFEVLKARIKQNQSHISLYKTSIVKMTKKLKKNEKLLISQSKVNKELIVKQENINAELVDDTNVNEVMTLMINNERMQNENDYLKDNNELLNFEFNDYEDICLELQKERAIFEKGLQKMVSIIGKKCRNVNLKKLSKSLAEKVCNDAHDILSKIYKDYDIQ